VLTRDGRLDALTVKVERAPRQTPRWPRGRATIWSPRSRTTSGFRTGGSHRTDGVERSMGKMRRIVDLPWRCADGLAWAPMHNRIMSAVPPPSA
jgi:hypothetical protein